MSVFGVLDDDHLGALSHRRNLAPERSQETGQIPCRVIRHDHQTEIRPGGIRCDRLDGRRIFGTRWDGHRSRGYHP